MKVFLAGGTGAIGRQLVPRLVERGHGITAISRTESGAGQLRESGARSETCDVFDSERLVAIMRKAEPDAVIHQLTDIPPDLHPRRIAEQMSGTNRLRVEGTAILMDAARACGARKFIAQSIAFLYEPADRTPASEETPLYSGAPSSFRPLVEAVESCERTALDTPGIEGTVLRYGYFYGPGTIYAVDGSFATAVRQWRIPVVGAGSGVYSFIHVADAAAATVLALDKPGGTFNVVDDDPAEVREWLPFYAGLLGAKVPVRVPAFLGRLVGGSYLNFLMVEQRGASNALAKSKLGWQPRIANWRDGFRSEFA